jgi:Fe-S cluster assembly protein SufD
MNEQTDTVLTADYAESAEAVEQARIAPEPHDPVREGSLMRGPAAESDESLPEWLRERRRLAWDRFTALPMPARTEQAWRFTSLGKVNLDAYLAPEEVCSATRERLIARSVGNDRTAGRMIFANDHLLDRRTHTPELASAGVIWQPLDRAFREHGERLRPFFMAQEAVLGSRKFAALHEAYARNGTFLYVPRNIEVSLPLEVFHWLSGPDRSTFPHTLIIADEGSKVTLVDYFESDQREHAGFACAVNDLIVGRGAKVTYLCAQNWSERVVSFQVNSTTVERDGAATSLHLNLGASYARLESLSRLAGEGGRSDMLAATVAESTQEFDQRTLQDHLKPHTTSDLLYKNALADASKTIFAGLIRVEPQAQHTDAYQKVRNLMLSDDAEANSMPGLEIMADEVRCTHGATSGHVDAEELFYLLARGIDRKTAQELIVQGFLAEVLERLGNHHVTPRLAALLAAKFARMKQLRTGA